MILYFLGCSQTYQFLSFFFKENFHYFFFFSSVLFLLFLSDRLNQCTPIHSQLPYGIFPYFLKHSSKDKVVCFSPSSTHHPITFFGLFHDTILNSISSYDGVTSACFILGSGSVVTLCVIASMAMGTASSVFSSCTFSFYGGDHFNLRHPFFLHLKHLSFLPSTCTGIVISSPKKVFSGKLVRSLMAACTKISKVCLLQYCGAPFVICIMSILFSFPYSSVDYIQTNSTVIGIF